MYSSPDARISLTGSNVWKGSDKSNGVLMMGDSVPHIETSYTELVVSTDLTSVGIGFCPFGNAVWYDDADLSSKKYAKIYTTKPATNGRFAGIMKYEQGIATGFPMQGSQYTGITSGYYMGVAPTSTKGTLIKKGFVWFKDCFSAATGTTKIAFSSITRGMYVFARNAGGFPVIATPTSFDAKGIPVLANCSFVGSIEQLEPETEGVLVNIGFNGIPNID